MTDIVAPLELPFPNELLVPDALTLLIMNRAPVSTRCEIKHIVIAWSSLDGLYAGRLSLDTIDRSFADAQQLALGLLEEIRAGAEIEPLMLAYSADPGTAHSGESFVISEEHAANPAIRELALRLEPEEAGLAQTSFGIHIVFRVR